MPTGYTSTLAQGEQSVADFIRHCGRGMGFMILMRDADWDAPLPEKWEPNKFHDESLAELQERKAFLSELDAEDRVDACEAHYAEAEAYRDERIEKNKAQLLRYTDMLEQVRAWEPSHPVMRATRQFAIDQLTESIKFDCSWTPDPIERLSPDEWHKEQFDEVLKNIQYHSAEQAKDAARTEERNVILQIFKDELSKLDPQS